MSRPAIDVRRVTLYLLATATVLLIVHLLLQHLNLNVYGEKNGQIYELANRFDFDDESSVPTWFIQAIFLAITAMSSLIAWVEKKPNKKIWTIIAAVALVFSIDEVSTMHENILQNLHVLFFEEGTTSVTANAWLVVIPMLLLAGIWLLRTALQTLPRRTFVLFSTGFVIMTVGAVGVDILVAAVDSSSFLQQGLLVGLEETMETVGAILMLHAVLSHISTEFPLLLQKPRV